MSEYRKKLIEVALPLEAINKESVRENYIYKGNPSAVHKWWAQRPLAACRAVLFAQMVDDSSSLPDEFPTEEAQEAERQRLFRIIEELVKWENMTNEVVIHTARVEIARSAARNHDVSLPRNMTPAEVADVLKLYAPPMLDPFAGGGSIPLEAQRLGLEAHASDLNPVAVLITKALIEIPPRFNGRSPVNPDASKTLMSREWHGIKGLAEDIRYYGKWMRDKATTRIGNLYPSVRLPKELGGGEAPVIAWLWARTAKCPNPACGVLMPLVRSFWLSTKKGKRTWVEPVLEPESKTIRFVIRSGDGTPKAAPKIGRGATFRCSACNQIANEASIRSEFKAKHDGQQLMAIVANGPKGRTYLSPNEEHVAVAASAIPQWQPEEEMNQDNTDLISGRGYGITHWYEIFTPRQLVALTTFTDLLAEVHELVRGNAVASGVADDDIPLNSGGTGARGYADAVIMYLAFAIDKVAEYNCTGVPWYTKEDRPKGVFARQAIPMVWDFAEVNPLGFIGGTLMASTKIVADALEGCSVSRNWGVALQNDAAIALPKVDRPIVSTDPPYYNNIGYAELSDFFYIWLRRSLSMVYPELFTTLLTPKAPELVATPYRFGGDKERAEQFFEMGLRKAFTRLAESQHPNYPLTVYYAFKQSETDEDEEQASNGNGAIASTGWETMLEGLLKASFTITGTWPMRTERTGRSIDIGTNALASSIVLVCHPRRADAPFTTRRDFLNALKRELPHAVKDLQRGNVAPVDLAQAAIGPGMAVFSRYGKVLESDGTPMRVRTALHLINQTLDEVLAEQEGEYDADTRWAVAWFEQYGMDEGPYGVAETLSKAKNIAVGTLVEAGILRAQGGKVQLISRGELSSNWNPATARRLTVWEVTQRLIRALQEQGDAGAAAILDHVETYGEVARDLAYRLYTICERKKWADEALAYNSLVVEWPDISGEVERLGRTTAEQSRLFL